MIIRKLTMAKRTINGKGAKILPGRKVATCLFCAQENLHEENTDKDNLATKKKQFKMTKDVARMYILYFLDSLKVMFA